MNEKKKISIHQALNKTQSELLDHLNNQEKLLSEQVKLKTSQLEKTLKSNICILDEYIRFGAYLSHEFRKPLSIIKNQTKIIMEIHKNESERFDFRLKSIDKSAEHLHSLFDEWINNHRICNKEQIGNFSTISINLFMLDLVTALGDHYNEVNIMNHCGDEIIYVDPSMLKIAIFNLIDNAIKHSQSQKKVDVSIAKKETEIEFSIKDYGVGLSESERDVIFLDYQRLTTAKNGTGLGMGLVKRTVELLGGRITVISEKGKGCEFCLYLNHSSQT